MSKSPAQLPEKHVQTQTQAGAEPDTHALAPLLQRPLHDAEHRPSPPLNDEINGAINGVISGVIIGQVTALTETGVLVYIPGLGERIARSLCTLPEDAPGQECAVLFENGDPARPLVVGLLLAAQNFSGAEPAPEPTPQISTERTIRVDGERLVIHADTELELRCGESVILLQRDGRIEIRGNYITSQATATQRLRGGSIHMN